MINIKIIKKKQKKLIKELRSIFEKNKIYSKLEILNEKILQANFWLDKNNSKNTIKEKKLYEDLINSYNNSIKKLKDLKSKKAANKLFPSVVSLLDKLVKNNVIHANKSSNLKSKLTKHISSLKK